MNSFITLFIICVIYYTIYKYYPEKLIDYHNYFFIFIGIYLVAIYMFSYETQFMYNLFKNIHDTTRQPLYSFNASQSNSEFFHEQNPNHNIKNHISQQQGQRCAQCNNFLLHSDSLLKYKIPLQNGGQNNISNLMIVCPTCFNF